MPMAKWKNPVWFHWRHSCKGKAAEMLKHIMGWGIWSDPLDHFSLVLSVMFDPLRPHGPQHARPPCPSPTPRVYSNSRLLSQWCHPTISSSVVPFSSRLQSFPGSGPFQMSQFFTSGGQNFGVSASASVLPMNIQNWFPLGLIDWIFLQFKNNLVIIPNSKEPGNSFNQILFP